MSYTQFGYTYPSSSQLLMTGQHPATATPCCQAASPAAVEPPYAAGGAPQPTPAAAVCSLPAAYDSRLLSSFPRLATGLNGLYATSASTAYAAADPQGYVTAAALAAGSNPSFYSSLPNPYDLKESRGAWAPLSQGTAACYSYDPTGLAAYGPYGDRYSSIDSVARRKNATRETTNTLKAWLYEHRKNPYPTKGEKIMLAIITKMTLTQVSTWFANARRRLKKENKMTWEPRNKSADSADADDKEEEEDDDDNNSSSPSPALCDIRKKSPDNSCPDDDDSQDLRVKPELASALPSDRMKSSEFSSCSVKSESTKLGPSSDCLALNLGSFASDHHPASIMACSPEPDYHCRPGSPISPPQCTGPRPAPPLHHRHYDDRRNHPHQHPHHHQMRPFHHQPAHQHLGTTLHPTESSQTDLCESDPLLTDDRPKIWSLAHTATSDSPPTAIKRSGNISPPPPPLTQQLLSSSSGGEDHYPIDCNSPKTTPPPSAVHSTIPGGYSCSGNLPSHAPSEQSDVHRRRWLNGGGNGDCARTVSDCESGNKLNPYGMGSYIGPDHRRYSNNSDGNSKTTNYNMDSTAAGCFSPPKNTPTTALFESCLESSTNVTNRSHTYKNDVSMVGSSSTPSYIGGGTDLNSSSSSSSSPGQRPPPAAPSSSTSSCDYAMQQHHSHGPVHHHHIKPPPYGNGETNNINSRLSNADYGLENSSASSQGKHMQSDKEKLISPVNVGLTPTSCLNIIR